MWLILCELFLFVVGVGLCYVVLLLNFVWVLICGVLFGFLVIVIFVLLFLVVKFYFEGSLLLFGLLLGCYGLGVIGGVLLNLCICDCMNNECIVWLVFCGFVVVVLVLVFIDMIWLYVLVMLFVGVSWVLVLLLFNVLV